MLSYILHPPGSQTSDIVGHWRPGYSSLSMLMQLTRYTAQDSISMAMPWRAEQLNRLGRFRVGE